MKKLISLIVFLSAICTVYAQDFTISFQPKVSGTPIDSIRATNLRTNQVVKLSGGESLLLVKNPTGINSFQNNPETGTIYPNPAHDNATFCFSTDKGQQVEIRLYNANGQLLNKKIQNLVQGTHRFELKFPGAGIYFVSLLKSNESTSFKAVYTGKTIQNSSISYAASEKLHPQNPDLNQLKRATTDKTLTYIKGDFIHYSVSSGVNTTIITETPTISKIFEVEFVSCIDKDNKSYKVVQIGTQWWMAENLAYLPAVYPYSDGSFTEPRYYVYDYQGTDVAAVKAKANYTTYGLLYNWPAAPAACPPGWHLPSDDEWKQLEMALGMSHSEADRTDWRGTDQGTQMKATSVWYNDGNSTNSSGFAALPAGFRHGNVSFSAIGYYGMWWSSTEYSNYSAWYRNLSTNTSHVERTVGLKEDGFSVRCVRDVEPISDFSVSYTAITKGLRVQFTDKSINNPTDWLWDFGDTSTSTEQNPLHFYSTTGIYTVSLKATNYKGSNTKTLTNYITVTDGNGGQTGILDYAGKTYQTITINGKEWMAENLAYLPAVYPSSDGSYAVEPRYYIYDYQGTDVAAAKNNANYSTYGVLYNWPAAIAACPPGWHLPSDIEWTDLITVLGGESVAGGKLKESGYTHWSSPNNGATNEIGFAALPAGYRHGSGAFSLIGGYGFWWSSTEDYSCCAWTRTMGCNSSNVNRSSYNKEVGFSVRCVKD